MGPPGLTVLAEGGGDIVHLFAAQQRGTADRQGSPIDSGLFFHLLAYDTPDARLIELGQQAKGVEVDTSELIPSP